MSVQKKKLRGSYARVLIEIDITQKRRVEIPIKEADSRQFCQKVVYERIPAYCAGCQKIGHNCEVKKFLRKQLKQACLER